MYRTDFINYLIYENDYKSYLEIGLDNPEMNFLRIGCDSKESVDPYNAPSSMFYSEELPDIIKENLTYKMTSDEMFSMIDKGKKYDIIFIDGLHIEEQVIKDIINSLKHLNPGGKILVHDCLPSSYKAQLETFPNVGDWNGSTWKAIPKLKELGVDYYTIDDDQGVCVINYFDDFENLDYYEKTALTYDDFVAKRNTLMNVISVKEFLHKEEKKHQMCFVTPLRRAENLEAIGTAIKGIMEKNPDFVIEWLIGVDVDNLTGDASKGFESLFKLNIPFEAWHCKKNVLNTPILEYIKNDWFQRLLDPWIYIEKDNVIPDGNIVELARETYNSGFDKNFILTSSEVVFKYSVFEKSNIIWQQ